MGDWQMEDVLLCSHEEYVLNSMWHIYYANVFSCMSWEMTMLLFCITEGYSKMNDLLCKLAFKVW